jgi:ABC-type amino acid transport substrate-binding protein
MSQQKKELNMKTFTLSAMAISLSLAGGMATAQDCPVDLPTIEPGKLTMSINATLPPRQFIDASGNLQGMHPDLGNEIARRLCLEPVYMNVSVGTWSTLACTIILIAPRSCGWCLMW